MSPSHSAGRGDASRLPEVPEMSSTASRRSKSEKYESPPIVRVKSEVRIRSGELGNLPEGYNEVDEEIERGKFRDLVQKTKFLNPLSDGPCRVSVCKPHSAHATSSKASESQKRRGEYKLRVDVPGSREYHPYLLEVADEDLNMCINAMVDDLDNRSSHSPAHTKRNPGGMYPDLADTGGFVEVDSMTEEGIYREIIEASKKLNLRENKKKSCRVSVRNAGKGGVGDSMFAIRVDIPAHGEFPRAFFVAKNYNKMTTIGQMKTDMRFRHKSREDPEWGDIYRRSNAQGAVVFVRMEKDGGGFSYRKKYIVRIWQPHEPTLDQYGKSVKDVITRVDEDWGFHVLTDFIVKERAAREDEKGRTRRAAEIRRSGEVIFTIMKTLGKADLLFRENSSVELKIHHPKARSSITNNDDSKEARANFATALPKFRARLLDHWVELKEAFGMEKEYNIVEITNALARLGCEWIELRDASHCKGALIGLVKVVHECHPGAKIYYKHGKDSRKIVKVQDEDGNCIAEKESLTFQQAGSFLERELTIKKIDIWDENYAELRKELVRRNLKEFSVSEKTVVAQKGVHLVGPRIRHKGAFVCVRVQHRDGEVYGCAEKQADAIQMAREQFYYTRVTKDNFGPLFGYEGETATKKWDWVHRRLLFFPGCDLFMQKSSHGEDPCRFRLRLTHENIGIICKVEAEQQNCLSDLVRECKNVQEIKTGIYAYLVGRKEGFPKEKPPNVWETLSSDSFRAKTKERIFLDGLNPDYVVQCKEELNKGQTRMRIRHKQTKAVSVSVVAYSKDDAFYLLRYLADFERIREDDPLYHSLFQKIGARRESNAEIEVWHKHNDTKEEPGKQSIIENTIAGKALYTSEEYKIGHFHVVRVVDKRDKEDHVFQKYGKTIKEAADKMEDHLDFIELDQEELAEPDLHSIVQLVQENYGRSRIFLRQLEGDRIEMKVDHPLHDIQACASGLWDEVLRNIEGQLGRDAHDARHNKFLFEGVFHLDATSLKQNFEDAFDIETQRRYIFHTVKNLHEKDGLFLPIFKACERLKITDFKIKYCDDLEHPEIILEAKSIGRMERKLNASLRDAVQYIVFDLNFKKVDQTNSRYGSVFKALRDRGVKDPKIFVRSFDMNKEQSQIIHGKEITYRRGETLYTIRGDIGEPKMKKIVPGDLPPDGKAEPTMWSRAGGLKRRLMNKSRVFVIRVDHKDLGYRFYYKYEQEKDIDAAITALAAHYSYRELTEDNYEKELAEVFEKDGLWAEKYKKKWKEIVLKSMPRLGFSRLFIQKLTGATSASATYRVKIGHDRFGLLARLDRHHVDDLLSDLNDEIKKLAKNEKFAWETRYQVTRRMAKPPAES